MSNTNNTKRNWFLVGGGCLLLLLCLCGVGAIMGMGIILYSADTVQNDPTETPFVVNVPPTATPVVIVVVEDGVPVTVVPTTPPPTTSVLLPLPVSDAINTTPIPAYAYASLDALRLADFPSQDYYESVKRLGNDDPGERTVPATIWNIGDVRTFITNDDDIEATLMGMSEHTYFWVDDRIDDVSQAKLEAAMGRLEADYLPALKQQFGDFWQPGVDNDARFSVLHLADFADGTEVGYFDSSDEYPLTINEWSNEQEIIFLNMDILELGEELYFGTLVHEIQHLIQWHNDGNEETWLDEGLAQVAETMAGLDSVDTHTDWLQDPDIQLNVWGYDDDVVYAHYGGAYLFVLYFWEQLGDEAVADLARHPANGLQAVEAVLAQYRPEMTLEQFVADWAAAVFIDVDNAGKKYTLSHVRLGQPKFAAQIDRLPSEETAQAAQFGVHYINIPAADTVHIQFAGDTLVPLIGSRPPSGDMIWLAPRVDNLQAQLSANFDLTEVDSATLEFKTWYDLEEEWDFAYVMVSDNGGKTWELLSPDNRTAGEFGPAFNGLSSDASGNKSGWVSESISLNRYAGDKIIIRFETLTDTAIGGRGFAIDDIAIPEIGYYSDVEGNVSEWTATGFVAIGWQLPQQWAVRLIHGDRRYEVIDIPLNGYNQADVVLDLGDEGGTLMVIPLTPFVIEQTDYWLRVE